MKHIVILIITALAFAGCCKKPIATHKVDSVRVVTEYKYIERLRDTTIYVEIPAESHSVIVRDSSYLETKFAASKARINEDGTLYHDLRNKPQSLPVDVTVKDTEVKESTDNAEVHTEAVTGEVEKKLTGFAKFLQWSGGILWLVLIGFVGFKIFRVFS